MGGPGSGNWYRWSSKRTTDSLHSLDINWLNRHGYLTPPRWFSVSWTRNGEPSGSITVRTQQGRLILEYNHRGTGDWESVEEPVFLTWTPCYFGKGRPWFVCPAVGCGRRVGKLYLGGRYFLCRRCHGLAYESQREDTRTRYLTKAQNIKRRLGGEPGCLFPFPDKPRGMHWRTYMRLFREYERFDALSWAATADWIGMQAEALALRMAADGADT